MLRVVDLFLNWWDRLWYLLCVNIWSPARLRRYRFPSFLVFWLTYILTYILTYYLFKKRPIFKKYGTAQCCGSSIYSWIDEIDYDIYFALIFDHPRDCADIDFHHFYFFDLLIYLLILTYLKYGFPRRNMNFWTILSQPMNRS